MGGTTEGGRGRFAVWPHRLLRRDERVLVLERVQELWRTRGAERGGADRWRMTKDMVVGATGLQHGCPVAAMWAWVQSAGVVSPVAPLFTLGGQPMRYAQLRAMVKWPREVRTRVFARTTAAKTLLVRALLA